MVHGTTGQRFEYADGESMTMAIIDAVATVRDADPLELSPLYGVISADALDTLVTRGDNLEVTFSYEGLRITVYSDGEIVVYDPK